MVETSPQLRHLTLSALRKGSVGQKPQRLTKSLERNMNAPPLFTYTWATVHLPFRDLFKFAEAGVREQCFRGDGTQGLPAKRKPET